ncbi:MAG: mannosyltransferase family protein [Anaerolineales bacterium]
MKPVYKIILTWLTWAIILIGYQALAQARFQPIHPDNVLSWTPGETNATSARGRVYLLDPFMNNQVAWDSEYYLSIATVGYDDPAVQGMKPDFTWENQRFCTPGKPPACYSRNYAFFPFYPYVSRTVALPLHALPLTPIAASTLAGVIVSLLGALGAMFALYDLTRDELEESGALRAAFYLLIFPSGFFLAQVYTEGLFVGLAFGSLAFLRRRQWLLAGLLAAFATWTRAVGGLLLAPLVITWGFDLYKQLNGAPQADADNPEPRQPQPLWQTALNLVCAFGPAFAWLVWNATLGDAFRTVESIYFSRGVLLIDQSMRAWSDAYTAFTGSNLQARVYYGIEFAAILLAVTACILTAKRYPLLSLFGLLVIVFSFFSGAAQGMARYVLAVPSIFILLARWGKNPVFERVWTLLSLLVMGLMATLFTFNFWAG